MKCDVYICCTLCRAVPWPSQIFRLKSREDVLLFSSPRDSLPIVLLQAWRVQELSPGLMLTFMAVLPFQFRFAVAEPAAPMPFMQQEIWILNTPCLRVLYTR